MVRLAESLFSMFAFIKKKIAQEVIEHIHAITTVSARYFSAEIRAVYSQSECTNSLPKMVKSGLLKGNKNE